MRFRPKREARTSAKTETTKVTGRRRTMERKLMKGGYKENLTLT
jgi:hypothetical protein